MPKPKRIRILVADDHHIVRSGLAASLGLEDDLEIVGEAESGTQAIALFSKTTPDVVLMDLRMADGGGIESTAALRAKVPDARVIIYTTFDGDEDVYRAVQAGARGYLLKSAPRTELLAAIRTVAAGERYLPPELAKRLAERVSGPDVSEREIEVLRLISAGKSNKEIGATLHIAEDTVKRHVSNILTKLGVSDRAQAATEAIRRGFLHF
ncbi:MAG: response regulator transcription factor [Chthoniobacteraceae bacterium]